MRATHPLVRMLMPRFVQVRLQSPREGTRQKHMPILIHACVITDNLYCSAPSWS